MKKQLLYLLLLISTIAFCQENDPQLEQNKADTTFW